MAAIALVLGGSAVPVLRSSVRPAYGGTLRLETRAAISSLDPAIWTANEAEADAAARFAGLVFEPLVRLDGAGRPAPCLAVSWQHDAESKEWQFRLRGARFHDGQPLSPAAVVDSLQASARTPGWRLTLFGETVVIRTANPQPDLLVHLAHPRNAVVRRSADGVLLGTGPFRMAAWEAGVRARFEVFDDHWAGRPYLDAIELTMGRVLRQQRMDLELGRADIVEIAPEEARRSNSSGHRVWTSAPVEVVALVFPSQGVGAGIRLRQAVAFSVDRSAIHAVLLQRQGEPSGALLPQWLSGYGFLFDTRRDLQRARQAQAELSTPPTLALVYDSADPLSQAIAERVAVNAREAGVNMRPVGRASGLANRPDEAWLLRWRIPVPSPGLTLQEFASRLGAPPHLPFGHEPETLYRMEAALLTDLRVVPLVHLPVAFGLSARVRNWSPARLPGWEHLADVWLADALPLQGELP